MAQPTVNEQYMLELINRGRLDPQGEAARYGINLNQGLAPGTISPNSKQPLAWNLDLIDAARGHSQWMLDTDRFSHTGAGGSSAGQRMTNAGYQFTGSWTWGENIAWQGTTGTPNVTEFIADEHENLFLSPGHRRNTLNGNFREIGIGALEGVYTINGTNYNAVMTTQNFAKSGSDVFLTGVAFNDLVIDDSFYTVGEGLAGLTVEALRLSDNQVFSTSTMDAGGYQIALEDGIYQVTFSNNNVDYFTDTITINNQNIKLDLDTSELPTSTSGDNKNNTPQNDTPNQDTLFFSLNRNSTLDGLSVANEDIVQFEANQFSKYFDGSDLGLDGLTIDAFDIINDTEILMSFTNPTTIGGKEVDDSDLVKFIATELGENTKGTWEIYFDASDVGLSTNGEDVDGVQLLANGDLLLSTKGSSRVSGISGKSRDEDLLLFRSSSWGHNTSGDWSVYFDGSDVGLSESSREDINAVALNESEDLYLSTLGSFSVNGLTGTEDDVLAFAPSSLGSNTSGSYGDQLLFDGSDYGLDSQNIFGLDLAIGTLV